MELSSHDSVPMIMSASVVFTTVSSNDFFDLADWQFITNVRSGVSFFGGWAPGRLERFAFGDDVAPELEKLNSGSSLGEGFRVSKLESNIVVLNMDVEKFGRPHWVHSHEMFFSAWKTEVGIARHSW
ncbi:hypothetical protein ACOMHN_044487 [Nucella lapillus]